MLETVFANYLAEEVLLSTYVEDIISDWRAVAKGEHSLIAQGKVGNTISGIPRNLSRASFGM